MISILNTYQMWRNSWAMWQVLYPFKTYENTKSTSDANLQNKTGFSGNLCLLYSDQLRAAMLYIKVTC